jgi:hypothetical protein
MKKRPRKGKAKTGPAAATVQIEGKWKDAVRAALRKKRPAGGWPKPDSLPAPAPKPFTKRGKK